MNNQEFYRQVWSLENRKISQLSASWVEKVKRNKSSLRKLNVQIPFHQFWFSYIGFKHAYRDNECMFLEHHRWKEAQRIEKSHQVLLNTMSKGVLCYAVDTQRSDKNELGKELINTNRYHRRTRSLQREITSQSSQN